MIMPMLVTLSGCYITLDDDDNFYCVNGRGAMRTETYDLTEFTKISNSVDATLRITTGSDNHRVSVSARGNTLDEVKVRTRDGELILDTDRCIDDADVQVDIFLQELNDLFSAGSGDIIASNTWITNEMTVNLSGSGNIEGLLEVNTLEAFISGSGNMTLSGSSGEAQLSIAGAGNLRAFGLAMDRCNVTIAGSGNMEVLVHDELKGSISGSGRVLYKSDPGVIEVRITGSGRLVDAN